jgi:hypothetical protein
MGTLEELLTGRSFDDILDSQPNAAWLPCVTRASGWWCA